MGASEKAVVRSMSLLESGFVDGFTVRKFQKFPATQIFRETNFRDFRGPKSATLAHLEALNFDVS